MYVCVCMCIAYTYILCYYIILNSFFSHPLTGVYAIQSVRERERKRAQWLFFYSLEWFVCPTLDLFNSEQCFGWEIYRFPNKLILLDGMGR